MQNRRKEDQGYIISLILTFAARWVQLFFAFLGSMIPEQFQDLIPSALVMFFIWSVPICQAAACFVAIRYIQRNPDKQKQGVICLVIAFPVGYFLSRLRVNKQHIMLMLVMLPMWMNFLLRTYAWMGLLSINGPVNAVLGFFGLGPYTMLNTSGAVVLGMVYNYLPFMILPIYSVIVKLDYSLLEAARDLGANNVTVFRKVILPLSLPGVLSGITMVFVPSVSTFAISRMLGGGTELLLGDLIERQFLGGAYNPQLGAAISLVMMIIVVICMLVMNRFGEGEEQAVML